MKKIFSLLLSLTMTTSLFIVNVSAATLPSSVTINTSEPVKVDATEYEENTEETLAEGYSAYKVNVTLSTGGISLTGESTKSAKGVQLGNFTYDISFDDASHINSEAWVSGDVYTSADAGCDKFDPTNSKRYFFASTAVYPGAVKTTITDPIDMVTLYFAIEDGYSATATLSNSTIVKIGNYSGGSSADLIEYRTADQNIVFNPPSFTIGSTSTKEFDKVETAEDQAVTAGANAEGKYVANSKGETKFLKHIATILTSAKASKKVRINKLDSEGKVADTQTSGRTLGEILGGVATPETTISGKIAVGVMTTNNSDVFSFELVD